ncbi:single insulin-like growth factor-binding domain protein-2 [Centruroides sculpturatus]|uniref:single insulin-like growth factor-binding domain protein-2 n=1 Tax=Centruroides sculpturatus TaxID=218467 RepID=UPI000C6EEB6A|nr:single insulin-like growth factor-binding domain protein-2 [Centruroides sculpturatus]XP_023239029.1 single insulin-like growth factor-binding domain protein-2 [Centruroides sculpturatus]XP_023239031.1 single insulin-like growth factor-binding domain protein-2 [Centruroides sculpturatus]
MNPRLITFFIITFCLFSVSLSLKCRSCSDVICVDKTEEDCPGVGVTKYGCKCCKVCAQGIGQECGGLYNIAGICGRNLVCIRPPLPEGFDEDMVNYSVGTCQEKPIV